MLTYLIHGGHVLSMDGDVGDYPRGDVLVHNSVVIADEEVSDAGDAEVIDASRMVVLPGLVEVRIGTCGTRSGVACRTRRPGLLFALHRLANSSAPARSLRSGPLRRQRGCQRWDNDLSRLGQRTAGPC